MSISAFGVEHEFSKFEAMPKEKEARRKRQKQYAAGAAAAGVGVPLTPTKIKVSGSKNPDKLKSGKSKTKYLRGAVVGEGFRIDNDAHTARLARKIQSEGGFDKKRPVTVGRYKDGSKIVIEGHHRIRAAEMLGVKKIPTKLVDVDRKTPTGFTPLFRRGKFRRDVKEARKPNPKLSRKELKELAGKETGWFGRKFNKLNGKIDGGKINRVISNPKTKIGVAGTGVVGAGAIAAHKYRER